MSAVAVLDLRELRHPDVAVRRELGRRMVDVCRTVGFFYIVNHGISGAGMSRMFELTRAFFDLPMEEKMALSMAQSKHWRGYLPMQQIGNDPALKGNELESFHVWQEHAPDDPDVIAGKPLHGITPWPSRMPGMREEVLAYATEVTRLARDLVAIAALGLDLPESTFLRFFDKPMALLRLLHYPPQSPSSLEDGRFGTRPHTDNGAFTLLAQDDVGGLEIRGPQGEWIGVPPVEGSFVVNLGEAMKVWTNGLLLATPHRVINRYGKERYSIPFFLNPSFDAVVAPILKERAGRVELAPQFHSTVELDRPITSGEILTRLYRRIWPSANEPVAP